MAPWALPAWPLSLTSDRRLTADDIDFFCPGNENDVGGR